MKMNKKIGNNENLILSYASGEMTKTPCFSVFLNSIKNVPNADLVFITHEMDNEIKEKILRKGFHIEEVKAGENYYIFRDRHQHFYNYLCKNGHNYKYVLITDSRDVVFQDSPFKWIEKNYSDLKNFVVLMAEGFKRQESGFACIEHFEFQRDVPLPHLKNDNSKLVCNAGITLGTSLDVKNFELLIFMSVMKTIGRCTDQAALNYLMHIVENDKNFKISLPCEDNLCLTGEGVRLGSVEPLFINKKLYNPKQDLYHIIHQWDRLDGLREDILAEYDLD